MVVLISNFTSAAIAPELMINDDLKACKSYQPSGLYELPSEWKIVQYEEGNVTAWDFEGRCKIIGYTYDRNPLQVMKPYYKNWMYVISISAIFLILLGTVLLYRSFIYKKVKKTTGKWMLFLILEVFLILGVFILSQVAWYYVYPCSYNFC